MPYGPGDNDTPDDDIEDVPLSDEDQAWLDHVEQQRWEADMQQAEENKQYESNRNSRDEDGCWGDD